MKAVNLAKDAMKRTFLPISCAVIVCLHLVTPNQVQAKPRPVQPPWPSQSQLYREGFNQPYHLSSDQTLDSSTWTESWSGWALNRSSQASKVTPWRVPMLTSNGQWNLDPQRGAFQMWYRPEYKSGSGPGSLARLLTLVSAKGNLSAVWWSLAVSADGTCLQLVCETAKGSESCASVPVSFQAGNWYLLTLGYTETNTALFVDDQQVAEGNGLLTVPEEAVPFTSLLIGSGLSDEVAAGQIEEFAAFTGRSKLRRETLSPFGIDPTWEIQGCWARLNPVTQLGPITPEEETTTRDQVFAQRATLLAARQAAAVSLASSEEMMMLDGGGGPDYPESGDTNLWMLPPLIQGTNLILTLYSAAPGFTNKAYEVYSTSVLLNSNTIWTLPVTGRLGQINFTNPMIEAIRFYRATEGTDWDGDGILNWMDADPRSTNVGALTITIESPTNNATLY